jgi:quercetin dioxygenase-like cupin family protein
MRATLITLLLLVPGGIVAAQGAPTAGAEHAILVLPDQLTWKPAPPSLPPGARAAVLEGNPKEAGPFTMRIELPDGYKIPPHYHPAAERVTVIKGSFQLGMGDKFDPSALNTLPAGSYVSMKAETHHFAQAKGNTVVQSNGVGPWKLVYVNPADDPSKKEQS